MIHWSELKLGGMLNLDLQLGGMLHFGPLGIVHQLNRGLKVGRGQITGVDRGLEVGRGQITGVDRGLETEKKEWALE